MPRKTHEKELNVAGFTVTRLRQTILLGIKSLWMHRLRSMLTVLGIVFGVSSVIAMLAVGEGASFQAQEQIRRLGSNNIILKSKKPTDQENVSSANSYVLEYGLTYNDVARIHETIPGIELLVPGRIIGKNVWNKSKRIDAEILGTVPWYSSMQNLKLQDGRYFTDLEMEGTENVCVISAAIKSELFPFSSAVGRNIRVDADYYKVIGVMESESDKAVPNAAGVRPGSPGNEAGLSSGMPIASSARMYIPLSAARERFGEVLSKRRSGSFEAERVELHEVTVKVIRQEDVEETAKIIGEMLKRAHKKQDYELIVPLELLRQAEQTQRMFNIVLGAIAAISLLVGGIGIMNIMLASVTERTREIGIRRALGAKRHDIIVQFLIETVLLSSAGGLMGVALGVTIPKLITTFALMPTIVTPSSTFLAFSISAAVGVIFGIYPALRAADMDPVEALRHE